jgi:hypothetical protein
MKDYALKVADYTIRFRSVIGGPDLIPGERFHRNLVDGNGSHYDLLIRVHSGPPPESQDLKRVFHAPLIEEVGEGPVRRLENFWSVYKHKSGLLLKTIFPRKNDEIKGALRYSLEEPEWDLYIYGEVDDIDPFEYPLDGLILYYLTVMNGDIFIHGSAVMHNDRGYLFTGVSGSGKTTMAKIWEREGALVIHDDRVIIRKTNEGFTIHNTPIYNDEAPRQAPLSRILLIGHGLQNELMPMRGANALSRIMANCIQHNWSVDLIGQLTGSLYLLTTLVPVAGLWFVPNASVVKYILDHDQLPPAKK